LQKKLSRIGSTTIHIWQKKRKIAESATDLNVPCEQITGIAVIFSCSAVYNMVKIGSSYEKSE